MHILNSHANINELWNQDDTFNFKADVTAQIDISESKHIDAAGRHYLSILNLTDIHYSHDRKNLTKSRELIKNLITSTAPDLITLTGDQISFFVDKEKYLYELCTYLDGFGIPWAPIIGNHEGANNKEREAIGEFYVSQNFKNIIFRKNDKKLGVGNYIINITNGAEIVHTIMMMDSHSCRPYDNGNDDFDYIWEPQFNWYKWAIDGITKGNGDKTPVISCFLHMPPAEFEIASKLYKKGLLDGINDNNEPICCPGHKIPNGPYNNGFFEHIKNCGTKLILCGHDHTNTANIEYQGVMLAYSMCSRRNRRCNGYLPAGTCININANGSFYLDNYVELKCSGKVRKVTNIGKFYTLLKKLRKLFS